MNIETTALLQYKGITDSMINISADMLVNKSYVDRCFYPFSKPTYCEITNGGTLTPSKLDSYWVIKDFGANDGTVSINLSSADCDVVTFELMIVKTVNDTGTISFDTNIKWLGGEIPQLETNKIYFFVFRAIHINDSWIIIGNNQGNVSITE